MGGLEGEAELGGSFNNPICTTTPYPSATYFFSLPRGNVRRVLWGCVEPLSDSLRLDLTR